MGKTKAEIMQEEYGSMDKISCRGCCNLEAERDAATGKARKVCIAFGRSEAWKDSCPACGLYGTPFEKTGKREEARKWRRERGKE